MRSLPRSSFCPACHVASACSGLPIFGDPLVDLVRVRGVIAHSNPYLPHGQPDRFSRGGDESVVGKVGLGISDREERLDDLPYVGAVDESGTMTGRAGTENDARMRNLLGRCHPQSITTCNTL